MFNRRSFFKSLFPPVSPKRDEKAIVIQKIKDAVVSIIREEQRPGGILSHK